jgi:hypothetical protein
LKLKSFGNIIHYSFRRWELKKEGKLFAANHDLNKTYSFPVTELFDKLTFFFQGSNMAEHFLHTSSRTDINETEQLSTSVMKQHM